MESIVKQPKEILNVIVFLCRNVTENPVLFNGVFNVFNFEEARTPFYIVTMINTISSQRDSFKLKLFIVRKRIDDQPEIGVMVADQSFELKGTNVIRQEDLASNFIFTNIKIENFYFPSPGDYQVIACWADDESQFIQENNKIKVPKDNIAAIFDFKVIQQ